MTVIKTMAVSRYFCIVSFLADSDGTLQGENE